MFSAIVLPVIIGLAVFLYGMKTMEHALQQWAGSRLAGVLERFTRTPLHGLVAGAALTAILQSSTAITVISIGLVNAGMMTFSRTLGIILGSNIGSCLTTELLALNLFAFAKPLLAVSLAGYLLTCLPIPGRRSKKSGRHRRQGGHRSKGARHRQEGSSAQAQGAPQDGVGTASSSSGKDDGGEGADQAVLRTAEGTRPAPRTLRLNLRWLCLSVFGFAAIMAGVQLMMSIGPALEARGIAQWFAAQTARSMLYGVLAGACLAALFHSSSATIAMAMGLAAQHTIAPEAGVAVILGANVGTCLTAVIAGIGSSASGKFVAWSHVILNLGGAILFYPFIPELFRLSAAFSGDDPQEQLARAQTLYNVICSLIALPICYLPALRRSRPPSR